MNEFKYGFSPHTDFSCGVESVYLPQAGYDVENSDFVTVSANDSSQLSTFSNVNVPGHWLFLLPAKAMGHYFLLFSLS